MKYIIIGTGNICRTYINAINNLEGSEIAGFISRSGRHPEGGSRSAILSPEIKTQKAV